MVAPFTQLLLLLLLPAFGQPELPSPDGACDPGFLCRNERHCAAFLDLKAQLDRLSDASERDKLIRELRGKVCNKAEMGVCCKENLEVINGNVVNNIYCISRFSCHIFPTLLRNMSEIDILKTFDI